MSCIFYAWLLQNICWFGEVYVCICDDVKITDSFNEAYKLLCGIFFFSYAFWFVSYLPHKNSQWAIDSGKSCTYGGVQIDFVKL